MKINLLIIACCGLLILTATDANAYLCSTVTPATVLTPPSITLQRDLPVGSPIGSEVVSGSVQTFSCLNLPPPFLTYQEIGIKAYGTYDTTINQRLIYNTNIEGVGYSVGATSINNCTNTGYVIGILTGDGNVNNRILCYVNSIFKNQPIMLQARIQFFKTAQTTGTGTVNAKQVGAFILRNDQAKWVLPESAISITSFNVTTLACTVNNMAISVPMGTVEKRAFSGPGTWPGDNNTRSFWIPLSCNAGTRVNLQIDGDVQNASQGVLNLTAGNDTAEGVGIQLLYNNAPLHLSSAINTGTSSATGIYNIPLQARYYQTGNDVTPGQANASATFTLIYQ